MKYLTFISAVFLFSFYLSGGRADQQSIDQRVEELLSKMTLDEKVGQMVQFSGKTDIHQELIKQGKVSSLLNVTGAVNSNSVQKIAVEQSRLGIPLIFGYDVIHGYRTITPIPLAEACSWDPELVKKSAAMAAREARSAGVHWAFAPMVDITREPRWGRIAEGSGEDPYLGSIMAIARVEGFQGSGLSCNTSVLACLKHYVGYGGAEAGREYNRVDMSEKTLRETYLLPFKAGVESGAMSVMSAFNSLSGIPASANRHTITEILKQEWGFQGFVVSDWSAIPELINHGYASDKADAAVKALRAGVDMDMEGNVYSEYLTELVKQGRVSEEEINDAVRRILKVKYMLGLFENPYADPELEKETILSKDNLDIARDIAKKSIVLLKNDKNLLPLKKNIRSIAIIGPLADNKVDMLGTWCASGIPEDVVTVFEGIKSKLLSGVNVHYEKGCEISSDKEESFTKAITAAKKSDVVICVLGESAEMSGEAHSRTSLNIPGNQEKLLKEIYKTGTPVVLVLMNGRPLTIPWASENIPSIVEAWHLGVQAGNALADVLFGDYNPSGKLAVTFPRSVGQIPIYYNHENTGRPATEDRYTSKYIDSPLTPLYPFGYGLSYTQFKYDAIRLSTDAIAPYGKLTVTAEISNIGSVEGEEVVQLYIHDRAASIIRPVKELKGFKKIHLNSGEKKTVEFIIGPDELGFYNQSGEFVIEPGDFDIWIGHDSVNGIHENFIIQE